MNPLEGESLLPIVAAFEAATGQRPHPSTVWRWKFRGVHKVKLEWIVYGGTPMTSTAAVQRFIRATTEAVRQRHEQRGAIVVAIDAPAKLTARSIKAANKLKDMTKKKIAASTRNAP